MMVYVFTAHYYGDGASMIAANLANKLIKKELKIPGQEVVQVEGANVAVITTANSITDPDQAEQAWIEMVNGVLNETLKTIGRAIGGRLHSRCDYRLDIGYKPIPPV